MYWLLKEQKGAYAKQKRITFELHAYQNFNTPARLMRFEVRDLLSRGVTIIFYQAKENKVSNQGVLTKKPLEER